MGQHYILNSYYGFSGFLHIHLGFFEEVLSLFIAKDQTRGNTRIEWHRIQRMGKLIAVCRNAILQFLKQRTSQGPRSSFEM